MNLTSEELLTALISLGFVGNDANKLEEFKPLMEKVMTEYVNRKRQEEPTPDGTDRKDL